MKSYKSLVWGLGIFGLFLLPFVSAYSNVLDLLFRPFSGVNIGSLYLQYFYFIDAIVYLILFLGLTQYVFGKVYKSADGKPAREAKIIAVGMGLALTFAMAMFELQTGFNLGRLSWYAALILYILLYFFLFSLLKGMFDDVKIAFCISNLIMYGVLYSTFHSLYYWIEYNIPLLMALLSIALVISFICVLLQLFKLFSGGGNGDEKGLGGKGPSEDNNLPGNKEPSRDPEKKPSESEKTNTIKLINPDPESRHPAGKAIPIDFEVEGPGFSTTFGYIVEIDGKAHDAERNASEKSIHAKKDIPPTIPIGTHEIIISTYNLRTNTLIATTRRQRFVIERGNVGPRPPGRKPTPSPKTRTKDDPKTDPKKVLPGIIPGGPPPAPIPREPKKPLIPDDEEIRIDLSPDFNHIRSQDGLNACTAFAATSLFEYVLHTEYKLPKDYLSPLFLWYKTREDLNKENENTGPNTNIIVMNNLQYDGVCYEKFWHFEDDGSNKWRIPPDSNAENDAAQKKIMYFSSVDKNDPDQFVRALLSRHPLNIAVGVPPDLQEGADNNAMTFYHNINPPAGKGHAMVIVGYHSHYPVKDGSGSTVSMKAFKIRNSWDVNWGENGYIWISAETLKKILWEDPIIIKGNKSSSTKHKFRISGRAVFDRVKLNNTDYILREQTGEKIFSDDSWPNPIPDPKDPYYVGAMAQISGKLEVLQEIKVTDNKGRFDFEFETDPSIFEKLTALKADFRKQFHNINFDKLSAGVIVYKRHHQDSPDKSIFFHIVEVTHSFAGRGGEGHTIPANPCSFEVNPELNHSGIPITFDKNHTHEMNVIIPVCAIEDTDTTQDKKIVNCKIAGRVVLDKKNSKKYYITDKKTGKQIFEDTTWPVPQPPDDYYVGALAQINGELVQVVRPETKCDKKTGKFSMEFPIDSQALQPLTQLQRFPQFKNIDFSKLPAGVVVYKKHADHSADKEWFFHVVNLEQSLGGRGGERGTNPCSYTKNKHLNCSGIPILFDDKHTHEEYVIIPIPINEGD